MLNFVGTFLEGTIPTELGLCTSLGKYALLNHVYPPAAQFCHRRADNASMMFQERLITHGTNLEGDIPTQLGALSALRK
jgi:hypothetical protein